MKNIDLTTLAEMARRGRPRTRERAPGRPHSRAALDLARRILDGLPLEPAGKLAVSRSAWRNILRYAGMSVCRMESNSHAHAWATRVYHRKTMP